MANKYTRFQEPPKEELEKLYHGEIKTQLEIAAQFGVTQKMVFGWFKRLGIKARIPFKRDQRGANNSSWKGNNVTYTAYHYRVRSARGKANKCDDCGRSDTGIVYDWANQTGKFEDVNDYKMMCRSCHFKFDGHRNNFPNRKETTMPNKRKLIDGKL